MFPPPLHPHWWFCFFSASLPHGNFDSAVVIQVVLLDHLIEIQVVLGIHWIKLLSRLRIDVLRLPSSGVDNNFHVLVFFRFALGIALTVDALYNLITSTISRLINDLHLRVAAFPLCTQLRSTYFEFEHEVLDLLAQIWEVVINFSELKRYLTSTSARFLRCSAA